MLGYLGVRLTEIETVDARVSAHCKVLSYRILLIARHVIKDKNGIRKRLARWNDFAIIRERKIANFIYRCQQIFQISIFRLLKRFRIYVHVLKTYTVRAFYQTYQHVSLTTIRRTANNTAYSHRQHVSMLAYFFLRHYFIIEICHFDYRRLSHEPHSLENRYCLSNSKTDIENES